MSRNTRLAIDIGGTFTDLALEIDGRITSAKVLTTPAAPERGVMDGIAEVLTKTGLSPADVAIVIHGTTLATNALIERKGARAALITTRGFRDVLALGNEGRYDQYDLGIVLPEPLIPRHLRLTVPERLDNEGNVLLALDEAAVHDLVPVLRREKVESVAVGFLHAFVNPDHERRVRDILAAEMPEVWISLSSDVSPEMREWERFSTTAANAYVQPLMARYLTKLELGFRDMGLTAPLFLMLSGGGLTTVGTAKRFPIRMVESGPAGGAIFAADLARRAGIDKVLSFDMGGTTAKVCLIDDYQPQASRSFEVARVGRFKKGSGLPLRIPVIDMVEIGAGGGSLAHLDALGRIAVGPESAGAEPGPACYGRGGVAPTVTDANLLLGRYDPDSFAGGRMTLDADKARAAVAAVIGEPLSLPPAMAALGVVEMVDENMANAARVHAIESGKTHDGRAIIAFGGGGPVHATRIAEKIGIARVVVPAGAGVGSAVGFLRAPVRYEVVRSRYQRLGQFDALAVNSLLSDMEGEARAIVERGSFGAPISRERIAFMRYVGQGHEIPVPLPDGLLGSADAERIRADFASAYAGFYDRTVPGSEIEIMSYVVIVSCEAEPAGSPEPPHGREAVGSVRSQEVRDPATGEAAPWAVYDRATLGIGAELRGPCIIAEDETSTLVGPRWRVTVEPGYLDLRQEQA